MVDKKLIKEFKTTSIEAHNLPVFDANQRRVFIYIDGGNFYHLLKKMSFCLLGRSF